MKRSGVGTAAQSIALCLLLAGCGASKGDPKAEAPLPAQVEPEQDANTIRVDDPEKFPLTTAAAHNSRSELVVTGVVAPDISRNVPVVTLASGRVVDIQARLGDAVKKGQLLLRVRSADVSGAYSDYRKAVADEALARTQFERARLLYDRSAISLNDFQVSQDAEDKAKVDVETTSEH